MKLKAFIILSVSLLSISGCQNPAKETNKSQEDVADESATPAMASKDHSYRLVLKCSLGGQMTVPVSQCIGGSGNNASGSVKITTDSRTKQYTDIEIWNDFSRNNVSLPLGDTFEVVIQTNSADNLVLDANVSDHGNSVAQDQASEFGVITFDSESIA